VESFLALQWNPFWHCSGIVLVFTDLSFSIVVVLVGADGAVVGAADIVVLVGAAGAGVDADIVIVEPH